MPKDFGTAGPRAIYPDACRSLSLAAVSGDAERLFWRLVSQADDQGRLEGDAFALKSLCVPRVEKITPRGVTNLLAELQGQGLVLRYAAGGLAHLVQIVTWWRWQAGMRRAYPSKWPAPEGWTDYVYGLGDDGPKTYREAAVLPRGARKLPADSAQTAGNLPATSGQLAGKLPADREELAGNLRRSRAPARTPAQPLPVPSAGAGAGAGAYSLLEENRSSSPSRDAAPDKPPRVARPPERSDVQALLDFGWKRVTPGQRRILDEVLERHDVTGPAWAARIIAKTPRDRDPLEAVKAADSAWQREQRDAADRSDEEWQRAKKADAEAAPAQLARLGG